MSGRHRALHQRDFENPTAAPNLKFEREDWTSFRHIEGLTQKAGVSADILSRLVLKEITDNALDVGADLVEVGELPQRRGYFVEHNGRGIDGTPGEIARLFSIRWPMVSTKYIRRPTRGALGNGLRVVAGAVLASAGTLTVTTRGRRIQLRPSRDVLSGGTRRKRVEMGRASGPVWIGGYDQKVGVSFHETGPRSSRSCSPTTLVARPANLAGSRCRG
jgi:hypothetical protein